VWVRTSQWERTIDFQQDAGGELGGLLFEGLCMVPQRRLQCV
jgi:hypothetical protein